MRRLTIILTIFILVVGSLSIYSATGTPSNLVVRTDANNSLIVVGATQTSPITQGVFASRTLRTDSNGNLQVIIGGGPINPTSASFPASTCAAPAINMQGGTTTGIAFTATPTILMCIAGTEVSRFNSSGIRLPSGYSLQWNNDLFAGREGANHWIQNNSTNAQRLSITNTYTSATNYEAFSVDWQTQANVAMVGTRTAATGTGRNLRLVSQGSNAATFLATLNLDGNVQPYIDGGISTSALGNVNVTGATPWIRFNNRTTSVDSSLAGVGFELAATLNQTSTAGFTDFKINRTQTAVGSGTQRLIDAQVGGVSQFSVSNAGLTVMAGSISAGGVFYPNGGARNYLESSANGLLNIVSNNSNFGIQINSGATAAPTFNNGTIDAGSRNSAGKVVLTGGNTGGTVTFATPNFTNTPFCTVTGTAATDVPQITSTSTSTLVVAGITANGTFYYLCIGRI